MKKIEQKEYGNLKIDGSEKDIVVLWMDQKIDPQVIHVENEKVPELIEQLKKFVPGALCECGYKSGRECFNDCMAVKAQKAVDKLKEISKKQ